MSPQLMLSATSMAFPGSVYADASFVTSSL